MITPNPSSGKCCVFHKFWNLVIPAQIQPRIFPEKERVDFTEDLANSLSEQNDYKSFYDFDSKLRTEVIAFSVNNFKLPEAGQNFWTRWLLDKTRYRPIRVLHWGRIFRHYFWGGIPTSTSDHIKVRKYLLQQARLTQADLFVVKDLPKGLEDCLPKGSIEVQADYQMISYLRPHWKTLLDYEKDLHSKYASRYKKIVSSGKFLEKRFGNGELLKPDLFQFFQLHEQIVERQDFVPVKCTFSYLQTLSNAPDYSLRVVSIYHEEVPVAFCTSFWNGETYETHLAGINYALNESYQLYLNLLYTILEDAISLGAKSINWGRTAVTAKQNIGAEVVPVSTWIYGISILAKLAIWGWQKSPSLQRPLQERNPFKK